MSYFADEEGAAEPDINATPLIDVLLVLLVMLIVTIPVPLHSLDTAPASRGTGQPPQQAPIRIDVASDGTLRWNGEALPGLAALETRLYTAANTASFPSIQLHPARSVSHAKVIEVLAAAQRQGLPGIGLITQWGNEAE
ncbi:MAG: biopolymer transporter ExbD [Magnetospirillum sp.]|nr:biopolymer transporter ExbD [Magnetospirillum sp.]